MLDDLPARLWELVPPSRKILAWTAVNAYRAVPWRVDLTKTGTAGLRGSVYTVIEAKIGSRITSEFLPYSLIYGVLAGLLGGAARDVKGSRRLLEHCGDFMLVVMAEDIGLKEALDTYIAEDIDLDIASQLARLTPLGQCAEFLDATGADSTRTGAADISTASNPAGVRRLLRFSDSWDAPACLLEMVPEAATRFSLAFTEAIRRAAENSGNSGESFDVIDAAVGRPIREMAEPDRLIGEVVAEVIDEMFRSDEVSDELVNGCCRFIALAIDRDESGDGHLARIVQEKISPEFARIALHAYPEPGEFKSILREVVNRMRG